MDLTVKAVEKGSIAQDCNIFIGDKLIKINNCIVEDILDYEYYVGKEQIVLEFIDVKGEKYEVDIQKECWDELGITFNDTGFNKKFTCKNKCLFCFVDQLPKNMRKALYFKDDDWRLSFVMGNYITLTNLSTKEIFRITQQGISPLYISLHSTNKSVNALMLGRENNAFDIVKTFASHKIQMHMQIVLCEDINDKEILKQTIADLFLLNENIKSVAIVPVGLTAHREGLYGLKEISCENAKYTLEIVQALQEKYFEEIGTRFVFCSDEMYIKAKMPIPTYECYEDFYQIENGVGLMAKFEEEIFESITNFQKSIYNSVGIVTGKDSYAFMEKIADIIKSALNVNINVYPIENCFFGKSVTVTGLLTGKDIIDQLKGKVNDDVLFMCDVCFMENEDIMLDDTTLETIAKTLCVKIKRVALDGYEFIRNFAEEY